MNDRNKSNEVVAPQVGDIWQEVDPRFPRFVRVAKIAGAHAYIYAVEKDEDGEWVCAVNPKTRRPAPERGAQLKRFNGKRTGYALYHRTALNDLNKNGEQS